ncbi:hypothetical protein [Klebsiella variicola]|uniref:hypothetical protein n=1 Tax=Klebsiella variicola TaxID=244366 RepID=UPI0013C2BA4D|nr:hypothetical protein [Klebsiella variicola]
MTSYQKYMAMGTVYEQDKHLLANKKSVSSLKIDGETSLSRMDICLHFIFPLVAAFITCYFFKVMPTPVVGIMVNFGSITTALLMSAVVMVYDQKAK